MTLLPARRQPNSNWQRLLGPVCLIAALLFFPPHTRASGRCDSAELMDIRGNRILPEDCVYRQTMRITSSNTSLDCRGSTFIGSGAQKVGLMIDSRGEPLSDIVVKNCNFKNYSGNAIRVAWDEVDSRKGDDQNTIYSRSPVRVLLENITSTDSGGVGIFLDDYVSEITVKNSTIVRSAGVGIYMEHSSRRITVIGSRFIANGFRWLKSNREAIAIDSSADNIVENNFFRGNAAGGIFLYKNCGEHFSSGKQVRRWQHSNHNSIRGNIFVDEKVGIWLASRQKKDLSNWDCADVPVKGKRFYADFANFNTVEGNRFCRTATPIMDEGLHNTIVGTQLSCLDNDGADANPTPDPVSVAFPSGRRDSYPERILIYGQPSPCSQLSADSGGVPIRCDARGSAIPIPNKEFIMASTVTLGGNPVEVAGNFPQKGAAAPAFTLVGKGLADVSLDSLAGKRKILNIFPSVDTDVCAASVRRFNAAANDLNNTAVLCISADLPFAQARFCGAEGLDNVSTLSTMRGRDFLDAYGVNVVNGPLAGVAARAVVVLDENNTVLHSELVGEIKNEPDYEAALAVLQ